MKCPYCVSQVDADAVVCKFCSRDIYLFKPMMEKIAALEEKLRDVPDRKALEGRIEELEILLEQHNEQQTSSKERKGIGGYLALVFGFIVIPLLLLLAAHALITVVYDFKLIYLRLVSIAIPLPFAYYLFRHNKHSLLLWFLSAAVLAALSVIGMSGITSLADKTPILPQTSLEWREFIEYSASIAFSFLTGMLFGGAAYVRANRNRRGARINPWVKAVVGGLAEGKLSPDAIQAVMKRVSEFGGTAIALGATGLSIYTGLKGVLGG